MENMENTNQSPADQHMRYFYIIFFLSMFLGLLLIRRNLDNDIFFLLNSGRYVTEYGIPHIEPFTLHEQWYFVMQQWLTCVIFWQIYQHFGALGLLGLVYVMAIGVIYLYYRICMMISNKNWQISVPLTTVVGIFVCTIFMTTRPQIFSAFILLFEVFCLEKYFQQKKKKYLYFLPVLSTLMVNFHAALWGLILCVFIPYLIVALFHQREDKKGFIYFLVLMGIMIIAGLLNPYGYESMLYSVHSYGVPVINNTISEMAPLVITNLSGKIMSSCILITWYVYLRNGIKFQHLLLSVGMTYLTFSSIRSFFLFLLLATFPLALCGKNICILMKVKKASRKIFYFRIFMVIAIFIISCYTIRNYTIHPCNSNLYHKPTYSVVDYLCDIASVNDIRLWNSFNVGGYAEYRGIKCYIDPRAEVFLASNNGKENIYQEYEDTICGKEYYEDVFRKYGINYVVTNANEALYTYLEHDDNYQLLYEDDSDDDKDKYRLFKRKE